MQPPTSPTRQSPLRAARMLVAMVLLACAIAGPAAAADDPGRMPAESSTEAGKEPKCVHGCERWGKVCNVDPRGVYKCRRRCEKFGKICE